MNENLRKGIVLLVVLTILACFKNKDLILDLFK
jgi:hypothetical protein